MISDKDIVRLATLTRLEVSAEERKIIRRDLGAILTYVVELGAAVSEKTAPLGPKQDGQRNVLRADVLPSETEKQAAELLAAAPRAENNYFKVKRVR